MSAIVQTENAHPKLSTVQFIFDFNVRSELIHSRTFHAVMYDLQAMYIACERYLRPEFLHCDRVAIDFSGENVNPSLRTTLSRLCY